MTRPALTEFLDREIALDGVRIAYRDRGHGQPVVFLHGTPSHSFSSITGDSTRSHLWAHDIASAIAQRFTTPSPNGCTGRCSSAAASV